MVLRFTIIFEAKTDVNYDDNSNDNIELIFQLTETQEDRSLLNDHFLLFRGSGFYHQK